MNEPHLTRAEAAAWFADRGLKVMTADRLEKLAVKREGPPFSKLGRYVYYRPSELQAWLDAEWTRNRGGGQAA